MTPLISCPSCSNSIGRVGSDGTLQATCRSCKRNYGAICGKLSKRSSNWEALLYLNSTAPSVFKRKYEFRLATPDRSLKVFKFSTPGKEDKIPVYSGDQISVLYSTQGSAIAKLVAVNNHTTGENYVLPSAVPSVGYLMMTRGSLSTLLFFYAIFSGFSLIFTSCLGMLGIWMYSKLVDSVELTSPELQTNIRAEATLMAERKLLAEKIRIDQRIELLNHERCANQELSKRLELLKKKMFNVGETFYGTRITKINSAMGLLEKRIADDQYLINEYLHAIKMIDIELEASSLVDQLPEAENFTSTILNKLNELKAIEEKNRNFELQLEANEEVRRFRV